MFSNIDKIIADLNENYLEDKSVLIDIYEEMSTIASQISNREKNDEKLYPHIKKAVISKYLARGGEGLTSRNEGSISSAFENIVETLRNDIVMAHLRRLP